MQDPVVGQMEPAEVMHTIAVNKNPTEAGNISASRRVRLRKQTGHKRKVKLFTRDQDSIGCPYQRGL